MSVHPAPRPKPSVPVLEPYFQTDRRADAPLRLRPMTALDQMYAYFGTDLV
jgi:hypothetical protein